MNKSRALGIAEPGRRVVNGGRVSTSFSATEIWLLREVLDAVTQGRVERLSELRGLAGFADLLKKSRVLRAASERRVPVQPVRAMKYPRDLRMAVWRAYESRTSPLFSRAIAEKLGLSRQAVLHIVTYERKRRKLPAATYEERCVRTAGERALVADYVALRLAGKLLYGDLKQLAARHDVQVRRAEYVCVEAWRREMARTEAAE